MGERRGVVMDVRVGEDVELIAPGTTAAVDNRKITLTLEQKDGRRARLRIQAGDDVQIVRPPRKTVPTP